MINNWLPLPFFTPTKPPNDPTVNDLWRKANEEAQKRKVIDEVNKNPWLVGGVNMPIFPSNPPKYVPFPPCHPQNGGWICGGDMGGPKGFSK